MTAVWVWAGAVVAVGLAWAGWRWSQREAARQRREFLAVVRDDEEVAAIETAYDLDAVTPEHERHA